MPIAADHHGNLFSSRNHLPAAMATAANPYDRQIDSFNRHVTTAIAALSSSPNLLSLQWLQSLLDSFLQIHEEFHALLFAASPLSAALCRPISDHLDRSVKALDLLNAVRHGIDQVKGSTFTASIAAAALDRRQLRRAKKSLSDLALSISDPDLLRRTRSAAAAAATAGDYHHSRAQSWSVSRSWTRQLQPIGANLTAPRAAEIAATAGLAAPVYTMGCVVYFVMWTLVAAFPCQDRMITAQLLAQPPRSNYRWSAEMHGIYERVSEEARRRRANCGLLREVEEMERRGRRLMEAIENGEELVREEVEGLKGVCEGLGEGLEGLERQVREVFHGIVKSRSEGLDYLSSHRH